MVEITRDELLGRLQERGYVVHPRRLEYWQGQGYLPYPTRKWHEGATRAFFPDDHVNRVIDLIETRGYRAATDKRRIQTKAMLFARIAELERRVAELEGRADG